MTRLALLSGMARRDDVRWAICLAVVVLAHASVSLAFLNQSDDDDFGIDQPVVTIELAPGPKEEEETEATPPPKEETKPPETEAEVSLPEPPKPEPPQEQKLATAPPTPTPIVVVRRWESALLSHIERFKRYPADARVRGDQGIVRVAFTIDREGWVRASRILQSSGSLDLDQEVLGMLTRAQPVPRPPENIPAKELSFNVPIRFSIR